MKSIFVLLLLTSLVSFAKKSHSSRSQIDSFGDSKKFLSKHLDLFENKTIYCSCKVNGKNVDLASCGYKVQSDPRRASRLEWEHVVPAEAFGNSFAEWRSGSSSCVKRGRG